MAKVYKSRCIDDMTVAEIANELGGRFSFIGVVVFVNSDNTHLIPEGASLSKQPWGIRHSRIDQPWLVLRAIADRMEAESCEGK